MQFLYKDISINYVFENNKSKINLVFLHGWGQNIEMMQPIAKPFNKKYNTLILDLPGFGSSDEPKTEWDLEEYVFMLNNLLKELKIKNPILIGHSFGGKISLLYASKYKVDKLVLLASPFKVKEKKDTLKKKVLRTMKKIPVLNKLESYAKNHMGSTDYRNASPMMKKILVKHVNTDLREEAQKISCPTLLIWGTKDTAVDYEDAKELEMIISNCGLVTYEGATHYAYLERLGQTINVLKSFIGDDNN